MRNATGTMDKNCCKDAVCILQQRYQKVIAILIRKAGVLLCFVTLNKLATLENNSNHIMTSFLEHHTCCFVFSKQQQAPCF
jgi:hypothetical protein